MELTIDGRQYRLGHVGLRMQLLAEEAILAERQQEFERTIAAIADKPAAVQQMLVRMAFARAHQVVSTDEVVQWMDTPHGSVFVLQQALKAGGHDVDHEEAARIFSRMTTGHAVEFLQFQLDQLGLSLDDSVSQKLAQLRDAVQPEPKPETNGES